MVCSNNCGTFLIRAIAREEITDATVLSGPNTLPGFDASSGTEAETRDDSRTTPHPVLRAATLRPELRNLTTAGRLHGVAL